MSSEDVTAEIAAVLAEHEYALGMKRGSICTCGHVPTVDPGSLQTQQDYHRHHLADLLAARDRRVRAEALREAADFIGATSGIGRRASHYADGWYDGLAHALEELRDRADRIEADR